MLHANEALLENASRAVELHFSWTHQEGPFIGDLDSTSAGIRCRGGSIMLGQTGHPNSHPLLLSSGAYQSISLT